MVHFRVKMKGKDAVNRRKREFYSNWREHCQ